MSDIILWPCANQTIKYYDKNYNLYGWPETKFGIIIIAITNDETIIDNNVEPLGSVYKDSVNIVCKRLKIDLSLPYNSEKIVFYNPEMFSMLNIYNYDIKTPNNCFYFNYSRGVKDYNDLFSCLLLASSVNSKHKPKKPTLLQQFIHLIFILSCAISRFPTTQINYLTNLSTINHLNTIMNEFISVNSDMMLIVNEKDIKKKLELQNKFDNKWCFYLIDWLIGIMTFAIFYFYGIKLSGCLKKIFLDYQKIIINLLIEDIAFALKLNSNLTIFIGNIFLSILIIFKIFFFFLHNFYYCLSILWIYSFLLGFTFQYQVLKDLFLANTLHLRYCYTVSNILFKKTFNILISLLHLLRGKKYNTLTNKIESETFEQDELYLGTIILITLGFLFYTITFYYIMCLFVIGPVYLFDMFLNEAHNKYLAISKRIIAIMRKNDDLNVKFINKRAYLTL